MSSKGLPYSQKYLQLRVNLMDKAMHLQNISTIEPAAPSGVGKANSLLFFHSIHTKLKIILRLGEPFTRQGGLPKNLNLRIFLQDHSQL